MKRLSIVILMFLSLIMLMACDEQGPTTIITTDERAVLVNQAYDDIVSQLPETIDDDYTFPDIEAEGFTIEYFVTNDLLVDNLYEYKPLAYDQEIVLVIRITYEDYVLERFETLTQVRDEDLYQDQQRDLEFQAIFDDITALMPVVITSDYSLPVLDREDVVVTYESEDITLHRGRIIFSFPEDSEYVIITAAVAYMSEVRTKDIPVRLEAFDQLPKIPELHINTLQEAAIDSDETYTQGLIDLYTFGLYPDLQDDFIEALAGIRLRGNSTLDMDKKSYKIKFDAKREMFTNYAEKDWVLLANFADQSLIRTYLAHHLSQDLGMEFSPIAVFVDVYINGLYQGNYMLTDQVEATNDRVDIEEGSSDLNTGYLLEWDNRLYDDTIDHSDTNYFFIRGLPFVIKTPDWEDQEYSINQYYFIEDYMLTLYLTLENGEDYSNLIDEASFIDWFIINELLKNVDAGFSSIYFYKDRDQPLKMGPVWDFDLSLGNAGHLEENLRQPLGWYTSREEKNKLFFFLMQYESFRTNLKARWNEVYEDHIVTLLDEIHKQTDYMAKSVHMNFERWDIIGSNDAWYTVPDILDLDTYYEQVWFVYDYFQVRMLWLDEAINNLE